MRVMRLPPLTSLRAFEATARRRSFKLAAEELGVTPSAISHQIRQLEDHVGVRLLDRTPRAVTLTDAGRTLHDATAASFDGIGAAIARIRAETSSPTLTLTATPAFISHWLVPRLGSLQGARSGLVVRLHASDRLEALVPGRMDIAIRYGKGPYAGTTSRKLLDDVLIPVCSPMLDVASFKDLKRVPLIHVDGRHRPSPEANWTRWCSAAGVSGLDVATGSHLPDSMSAVQAAIAGQGITIVSRLLVIDQLHAGLLIAPFQVSIPGDAYHFVAPIDIAGTDDVAGLRDWFVDQTAPLRIL